MVPLEDNIEVRRRLSAKGRSHCPVRSARPSSSPGDSVVFEIIDGTVMIRRADPLDPFFHLPLFQALEEWSQDQTATVFRYP